MGLRFVRRCRTAPGSRSALLPSESGGERAALQTLRAVRRRPGNRGARQKSDGVLSEVPKALALDSEKLVAHASEMRAHSTPSSRPQPAWGERISLALVSMALVCDLVGSPAARGAERNPADKETAAEEKEPSAKDKEKAATFVREHRSGLVFVKGKLGSGSGFIAEMKGRKVLITNAHVMAGLRSPAFELLDRTPVRVGTATVAVGHDLVAFVIAEGGTGIPIVVAMDTEAAIGDAVAVLGDASGGGVVKPLHGELTGIGPDRVEISAPFELGNSGSPIVHLPSGKVIGVATYARLDFLLSGERKVRRFGYRLDSVKTWQLIDWPRFYAEADQVEKVQNATLELDEILSDFQTIRKERTHNYESPAIRNALDTYYAIMRQDAADANSAVRRLLTSLREACRSDVAAAKGRFSYDYFRRQLDANELVRGEFIKAIDKALQP
jgi:hypothetical protein